MRHSPSQPNSPSVADMRVAIIGAGIAGLACGRRLHDAGFDVRLFDKGRHLGGRVSTREADVRFDHGAQFLTTKSDEFKPLTDSLRNVGVLRDWTPRGADQSFCVPAPHARGLPEHLGGDLSVSLKTRVAPFEGRTLRSIDGELLGDFDRVVVTAPLAQARALLAHHSRLALAVSRGVHAPCWALMIDFDQRWEVDTDLIRGGAVIDWAAREASKPGRAESNAWVVHASEAWSRGHLEASREDACRMLTGALARHASLPPVRFAKAHRWRYARVIKPIGTPCIYDVDAGVAVAGDGMLGARIEAAWCSGVAAAERIRESQ